MTVPDSIREALALRLLTSPCPRCGEVGTLVLRDVIHAHRLPREAGRPPEVVTHKVTEAACQAEGCTMVALLTRVELDG